MARRRGRAGIGRGAPARVPDRFQTYKILAPVRTHHRRATCAEVDCPNWRRARCGPAGCTRFHTGWRTILPAGRADLLHAARTSGRAFVEKPAGGGLVEFVFHPGQQCFESPHWAADAGPCQVEHWVPLERPALYAVQGARTFRFGERGDLWAEHFAEHSRRIERLVT